ncbi:ribose 5-phosphate isomerase B [Methylacidimicrobium cyclopophantes]|uniref:Ribose 5-phosphate isomerase B n=1 Tax=Methylacidimicrobium cyclopophantes TaxID=1041766 RepID=A0A5E6MHR4_9BACT|nr:ribose 5-phosphate isomerase B [Methylacidimicrobium cyclopophantes]VVM05036.1 ribose 5-phosphate isomerase B [Methylacidimicrobium cyclopophantes]
MKISLGSDHAGFTYKEKIKEFLKHLGHEVIDCGTHSLEPVDYPDYIRPAAVLVAEGKADRGIVLGGSGNGEAMVANKVRGVRCAYCFNEESARLGRAHNDANVISLGERLISEEMALKIVRIFLETPFEGGRHIPRIRKIMAGELL